MEVFGANVGNRTRFRRPQVARWGNGVRAAARWLLAQCIGWMVVLLVFLAILAEGGMLILLLGERDYAHRIYPNVQLREIDLSNLTISRARQKIQEHYADILHSPLCLSYQDRQWCPQAKDIGVSLDIEGALHDATRVGRGASRLENARHIAAVWKQGWSIPLAIRVDQRVMQAYLMDLAQTIERPPRNAGVSLKGADVVVTSAKTGVQVLVDETIADMTAALQTLKPTVVPIRTRPLAPIVHDHDIQPVVAQLQRLLAAPVVLTSSEQACHGPCRWEWSPEYLASWLQLVREDVDGRPTVRVSIDQAAIRHALLPIAQALRREGTLPRLNWNNGQLSILVPGLPGRGLDIVRAHASINEALAGGSRVIDLPMVDIPPPVNEMNLATLGLVGPLSTGVSSFRASQPYRITNILAGANRLHGLLIPPGEVFSFNANLGPVDARGGFVQGAAIVNHRIQQEWGGGLCQVSTTMFRAAFWGGLPILERHEHQFRIGWYEELGEPPGMDAAIFTGGADLRFLNDTGGWLLIQTWADLHQQRLYITLYGPKVDRHVEMGHRIVQYLPKSKQPLIIEDPGLPAGTMRQTEFAQPGLVVEIYRNVWQKGELVRQDTIPTTFEPWPDVFVRGTGR